MLIFSMKPAIAKLSIPSTIDTCVRRILVLTLSLFCLLKKVMIFTTAHVSNKTAILIYRSRTAEKPRAYMASFGGNTVCSSF